jgi:hypothetical protein
VTVWSFIISRLSHPCVVLLVRFAELYSDLSSLYGDCVEDGSACLIASAKAHMLAETVEEAVKMGCLVPGCGELAKVLDELAEVLKKRLKK